MKKIDSESDYDNMAQLLLSGASAATTFEARRQSRSLSVREAQELWQRSLQKDDQRRAGGVYYTDAVEAEALVERACASMTRLPERILEPSCGGGRLVGALIGVLSKRFAVKAEEVAGRIDAMELDPNGLYLAQWWVEAHFGSSAAQAVRWQLGDTLAEGLFADTRYEFIFGNPPFGNAIDTSTRRSTAEHKAYQARFPLSAQGAFDKCALFVELASQLVAENGLISLILPQSWLAQPAGMALRQHLPRHFQLVELASLSADAFYEASVSTVAILLKPQTASADDPRTRTVQEGRVEHHRVQALLLEGHWGAAFHPFAQEYSLRVDGMALLGDVVGFSAGSTTEEAYQWQKNLEDLGSAQDLENPLCQRDVSERIHGRISAPFVIAGMIDPFELHWGKRPTRYLKQDYARPVLAFDSLSPKRQTMVSQARVLIPTLSRALEAWPDLDAETIGAVSTIAAWPKEASHRATILRLAAIVNSAWLRLQYACLYGALALQGGNTQVTKNKLNGLHIPQAWAILLKDESPASEMTARAALSVQRSMQDLHALRPSFSLAKAPASTTQYSALQRAAACWRAVHTAEETLLLLDYGLSLAPALWLSHGWLDILLMALAPDLHMALDSDLLNDSFSS